MCIYLKRSQDTSDRRYKAVFAGNQDISESGLLGVAVIYSFSTNGFLSVESGHLKDGTKKWRTRAGTTIRKKINWNFVDLSKKSVSYLTKVLLGYLVMILKAAMTLLCIKQSGIVKNGSLYILYYYQWHILLCSLFHYPIIRLKYDPRGVFFSV